MRTDETTLLVDGREYPAELALPDDDTDHGVVLLPGANHGPYGDVFDRLADALTDAGLALLRYESWGDDEALDDLDEKSDDELFAEYDAAVDMLSERGYSRVDVVAKSFGGGLALRHSPGDIDHLVLWAPFQFLATGSVVEELDPPEEIELPRIAADRLSAHDYPVDILQGDEDNIPVANARELADALPDGRAHPVEGADHSFVGGDPEVETVETTVDLLTDD